MFTSIEMELQSTEEPNTEKTCMEVSHKQETVIKIQPSHTIAAD